MAHPPVALRSLRLGALCLLALAAPACDDGCGGGPADDGGNAGDGAMDAAAAEAGPGDSGPAACDPEARASAFAGDLSLGAVLTGLAAERCTEHRFSFAAAAGSEIALALAAEGAQAVEAAITYPDDPSWDGRLGGLIATAGGAPAALSFHPPRSGEFFLVVRTVEAEAAGAYGLSLSCADGCERETTRFPIVLVHGWTGFVQVGPLEYFYGIPGLLEGLGFPVYVAELDPYNSTEVRADQLAAEVSRFLSAARSRKVNLVAHSQGGLDSRRLISTLGFGDRVSALVTVSTPHRGTPIADLALGLLPGPAEDALAFLLNLLGATAVGSESDALASFASLTEDYVQNEFNPSTPDDPRVAYTSWAGLTCPLGITCGDVCDVEIRFTYDLIYLMAGDNDGIVPVSSAPWGDDRGTIPADHFDEVGQLFGVTGPNFDHEEFYLGIARDLAAAGH